MVWPSPSNTPVKYGKVAAKGVNPAPAFQVAVAVASMLLPRA